MNDLEVACGEGTYKKVIKDYKKISLLLIDEIGPLVPTSSSEAIDLLEIVEARHKRALKAILPFLNLPLRAGTAKIGEKTLADAILDRMVHVFLYYLH